MYMCSRLGFTKIDVEVDVVLMSCRLSMSMSDCSGDAVESPWRKWRCDAALGLVVVVDVAVDVRLTPLKWRSGSGTHCRGCRKSIPLPPCHSNGQQTVGDTSQEIRET